MDERTIKLLDKCEAMSLLSTKASSHWSFIKWLFQLPLILTSSVMCILNSFDNNEYGNMKIPNVVVNGCSVLIMSLQNNLKVSEKVELFKNLSNQYLILAHSIEALEPDTINREMINNFTDKYDMLQSQCLFEDIPQKYKKEVINVFKNRFLPIQLHVSSCIKRNSGSSGKSINEIV
jgi:hypothetical protein